ncbi:hypothetical protein JK208_03270 [Gluconobacter sp. Dm-74]|uniref:hypothetical protein n=1 Tax=Gluconobacter sp. Dm-74 TaxID=2799803 RepID=UPI001B8C95D7|nr:hypothetical protein [Gluconobacter sp. Dm-74]MBS1090636.1 hypothetical protein [Gluconobacter sp. Dm-74]
MIKIQKENINKYINEILYKTINSRGAIIMKKLIKGFNEKKYIFIWYLFLIIIAGQAPIVLNILNTNWSSEDIIKSINEMENSGDFIMCAVSILSAGLFFLVKEYISSENINNSNYKSILILISVSLLSICSYFYMNFKYNGGINSNVREHWHWGLYCFSLIVSIILWFTEEIQNSAKEATNAWDAQANDLTKKSNTTNSANGVKL